MNTPESLHPHHQEKLWSEIREIVQNIEFNEDGRKLIGIAEFDVELFLSDMIAGCVKDINDSPLVLTAYGIETSFYHVVLSFFFDCFKRYQNGDEKTQMQFKMSFQRYLKISGEYKEANITPVDQADSHAYDFASRDIIL